MPMSTDARATKTPPQAPLGIALDPAAGALNAAFIHSEALLGVRVVQAGPLVHTRLEALLASHRFVIDRHLDLPAPHQRARSTDAPSTPRIYELHHPTLTARSLAVDPVLSLMWPLRLMVQQDHDITTVVMPRPSVIWPEVSEAPATLRIARLVDAELQRLLRNL